MNARRRGVGVLLTFVAFAAGGVLRWQTALPVSIVTTSPIAPAKRQPVRALDSLLADAEELIVSNDAFRLANEPASVRFDPGRENGGQFGGPVMPAPLVRPTMTLKAIVGGPPWQAIVDGIPGQPPGAVVRTGATFDKLTARSVTKDSVIIQGPDTAWVLTFRRMQ